MWSQYKKLLTRRPLLTKAVTASSLMSLSDLACQSMEREQKGHGNMATNNLIDWQRTLHVGVTGLTFTGPLTHAWYELLGKLPPVSPSTATTSLTGMQWASSGAAATLGNKMLLDALIFSPIAVAGYFVWRSMLEGRGFDGTFEKLQSNWSQALFSSWSFWPAANVINFTLVPLPFRVLYNNILSFFWNSYLTRLNNKAIQTDSLPGIVTPNNGHPEEPCVVAMVEVLEVVR